MGEPRTDLPSPFLCSEPVGLGGRLPHYPTHPPPHHGRYSPDFLDAHSEFCKTLFNFLLLFNCLIG